MINAAYDDSSAEPFGPRLGYLSGSPRIATIPEAENTGPRTHILSFIDACRAADFTVESYIQGDLVPRSWVVPGSQARTSGSRRRALAIDLVRIWLARRAARAAFAQLGAQVDWVYERFAAFCALGRPFQRAGLPWVLETNAPMFYEAATERQSMVLTSLARRSEMAAYRDCDVVVCVTEVLKELVVRFSGIDADKVVVVPNGVDTRRFDPGAVVPQRTDPGFTVVFVGAIFDRQGVELLLEAIHGLKRQEIIVHAVIVGTGPAKASADERARALGLGEQVTFTGRITWEQIPRVLAGCDLAYSGQLQLPVGGMYHSPLKLYEYLAMGLPVVASAFEDATALLHDGHCGYLFQPGDRSDLERALTVAYRQWQQNRDGWTAMGREGRRRMIADHSWDSRIRHLLDSCHGITGRHAQGMSA